MSEMKIGAETKAFELLEKFPWLKEELIKMNSAFSVIDNPLTKMMFRNATIHDIAAKFNLNEKEVITSLTEMIEKHS